MITLSLIILAYLIGSISSSVLLCKYFKLPDPRTQFSKNAGTTNALRIGGKKLAAMVFLSDFLKGVIPILLASFMKNKVYVRTKDTFGGACLDFLKARSSGHHQPNTGAGDDSPGRKAMQTTDFGPKA